jgi:tRNA A-37 threonylcarbamoyl transferase component Bud32
MPDWRRLEHAGWRWRVRPGEEGRILKRQWAPPEADGDGWRIVQRWGSRVSALEATPGGELFVKWYGLRHPGEALRFAVTPSRPEREWRMIGSLAGAGVSVADCLAVGERRRFGLWTGGILVLKAVTPPLTLAAVLKACPGTGSRKVVDEAACLAARLHDSGHCHHDLHGDNLLVDRTGGLPGRLVLIDLHEATRSRRVAEAEWLADLARLNAYTPGGRNVRMRFWVRYATRRGLPRGQWRRWVGELERETRRLWDRHYKKRGESIECY